MIEQGLFQLLASDAGVKASVGTDSNGQSQIYWILAPKTTNYTAGLIVMSRYRTDDWFTMDGATGLRCAWMQVDCYSTSYYNSRAIALAVRQLLEGYIGNLPDSQTTAVQGVFTENDRDLQYEEGGKNFMFRAMLEFKVVYTDNTYEIEEVVLGGQF